MSETSENERIRREKISKAMKGRKVTWSNKISKSLSGDKNPMFGKTGKEHHNFGKDLGEKHSENCSKGIYEKIQKEGFNWGMTGKSHSEESREKNKLAHLGDKSSLYIDGRSYEEYPREFFEVAGKVSERDNNKCKLCGAEESLVVHHIDENKKNNNMDNLITLCRKCHMSYHAAPEGEIKDFVLSKIKENMGWKPETSGGRQNVRRTE